MKMKLNEHKQSKQLLFIIITFAVQISNLSPARTHPIQRTLFTRQLLCHKVVQGPVA